MNSAQSRILFVVFLFLALPHPGFAEEIEVKPGDKTISGVANKAKNGDVIRLVPGEYHDSFQLGDDVTLQGAGADRTILIGTGFAAISVNGERVRIIGIEIRPGKESTRGIDSEKPLRVERCRLRGYKEGVNLRGAPLSDVVYCEFLDCLIGVRAYAGASPTVWGCRFQGGNIAIACLGGGPYVRNNLFDGPKTGVMLLTDEAATIRNNVFWKCSSQGVEVKQREMAFMGPSIRNNIFDTGGAAVVGDRKLLEATSHCVINKITEPAFRTPDKSAAFDTESRNISNVDVRLSLATDGTLDASGLTTFEDKGIRLCSESSGTRGPIGLSAGCRRPGCNPLDSAPVPEIRFTGPVYIANCVGEEYDCLKLWKAEMRKQSLIVEDGRRIDLLTVRRGGKEDAIRFDINRFMGETMLEP